MSGHDGPRDDTRRTTMPYVRRLEHVGVVVDDLEAATEFFLDLGLEREGATTVEGEWVDNIIGLKDARAEIVMVRTPDGTGKLELAKFHSPADDQGPQAAAANRLGIRHILFAVDGLDEIVDKLRGKGFGLVGKVQDYEGIYRLCYVRGPEGIIVELAEQIGSAHAR
jgi:catechol 2,3-dioxygenase-like lactoylglutathione lyase family enzyme